MELFTNTFANFLRYHKCDYQIKVVFPSKDLDVIVEECNSHEHILKDDYVDYISVSLKTNDRQT